MASVTQKKQEQGYVLEGPRCSSCAHFSSDTKPIPWMERENERIAAGKALSWDQKRDLTLPQNRMETNLRCGKGGFAVKKMGWCPSWAKKAI